MGEFGSGMSLLYNGDAWQARGGGRVPKPKTVIASEAKQSIARHGNVGEKEWIASSQGLLAMTSRYDSAFSPRVSREFCREIPALSKQRARGGRAPDAPDSRVCK
jgi:hypothetical protein